MEQKLDLIINMIKGQGESLNFKIDGVEERLNTKIDSLRGEMTEQYDSLRGEMTEQYDSLRGEMNEQYDSLRGEMNGKYNSLRANISCIEGKLEILSNQVTVLEAYAHEKCEAALDGWHSHLQVQEEIKENIIKLNSKTENHEIRISVLEDVLEA